MFYNIPDDSKRLCRISQHCKSSQTESACIATSECIKVITCWRFNLLHMFIVCCLRHLENLMPLLNIWWHLQISKYTCISTLFFQVHTINTYSMEQPDLYYFETIKMTSQAWSNFVWRIRAAGEYSLWTLTRLVMSFLWLQK